MLSYFSPLLNVKWKVIPELFVINGVKSFERMTLKVSFGFRCPATRVSVG